VAIEILDALASDDVSRSVSWDVRHLVATFDSERSDWLGIYQVGAEGTTLVGYRTFPPGHSANRELLQKLGVRIGATYDTCQFVWFAERAACAVWSASEIRVVGTGLELSLSSAGSAVRTVHTSDVCSVISFVADNYVHRGVRLKLLDGTTAVLVDEYDPIAEMDPTYGWVNLLVSDPRWISYLGRDFAAWLHVPHEDEAFGRMALVVSEPARGVFAGSSLRVARVDEWIEVPAGCYEVGLRQDEARDFAHLAAARARENASVDPDALHGERDAHQLDQLWGNVGYLYAKLLWSMPAHSATLPSFAIRRAPVTYAEYERFQQATGAASPQARGGHRPNPEDPVTGISWHEATAFAAWSEAELPTEAMWEAAVRPASRSPFGALGHELFEWCSDEFAPYPGAASDALVRSASPSDVRAGTRTRRGGAVAGFPVNVVTRDGADPDLRLRDTTFRLVRRR
jgi:formylglycine-generating enzyme required for sulfatase activity